MRDYLLETEQAIRIRPSDKQKTYYLCIERGKDKILCLPAKQAGDSRKYHCFRKFTNIELTDGLTSWNRLGDKLRKYFMELEE